MWLGFGEAWKREVVLCLQRKSLFFPPLLQIQCKLFVFDKSSQSWVERGRGLLRLNDMASTDDGTLQSRLGEEGAGLGVAARSHPGWEPSGSGA